MRAQFPGVRVDDLELFFHADGEPVGGHGGIMT
jgi:hypothetical protein